MSNEYITASEGPDIRDSYFRFSQSLSYADRTEEEHTPFSFAETGPPTETDLLPDEDFVSNYSTKLYLNAHEYDVAVIGGGPAGYMAAIHAAKLGAKVILFEKEMLGGLTAGGGAIVNLSKTLSYKNSVVTNLAANIARLLRSNRVRVEAGEACLKSANEVSCRGKLYNVSKVILCSGKVEALPGLRGDSPLGMWTMNDIFKATEAPARLMVFGGGSVGCEIAAAFAALGSSVILVEPEQRLLTGMDAQLAAAVHSALARAGVKIHTGISVKEISDRGGNPYVVTDRGGVICDKFLVATKQKLDTSPLGELMNRLEINNDTIVVNEYLETNIPGVYAAGDCTDLGSHTHAAYRMAGIVAENAMGRRKTLDLRAMPLTVYTTPGAAGVGMTEEEARGTYGDDVVVGLSLLTNNVRAMLSGVTDGFVKVLAGRKYGEIYGVHIFGAEAAEMIAEPAAMMRMEVTIHEVCGDIIHAHPTYSEAFEAACMDALSKGVA